MKAMVEKMVEALKDKVKRNLLVIQNNQRQIRDLLKQPVSDGRSTLLEEKYASNKVLLAENNDFINVQLTLTAFSGKYASLEFVNSDNTPAIHFTDEKECFEITINGQLAFDEQHPFYGDGNFFHKLMKYYQDVEDYENCSKLVREKSQR